MATFAKETIALKKAEDQIQRLNMKLERRIADRTAELNQVNERLLHELEVAKELSLAAFRVYEFIEQGDSIAARALRDGIARAVETELPIMLCGPVGAGKIPVAREIHAKSSSRTGPFIAYDCAQAATKDDSLFGSKQRPDGSETTSKAELARGGTLFLENAEHLDPGAQQDLLRYLQQPDLNIKVISRSEIDLNSFVHQGEFDPEPFKLLGSHRLTVPSLAERKQDILPLANQVVQRMASQTGKVIEGIGLPSQNQRRTQDSTRSDLRRNRRTRPRGLGPRNRAGRDRMVSCSYGAIGAVAQTSISS